MRLCIARSPSNFYPNPSPIADAQDGRLTIALNYLPLPTPSSRHLQSPNTPNALREKDRHRHAPAEVFWIFLGMGLKSFGGPIAHLGYFRHEFVMRRRWLDDGAFADLVALCQFLPGPASSQVGFAIGLMRAGYLGGCAAWLGFTLPSAVALVFFAYGADEWAGAVGVGLLHGLKLVAVAVVAQAVVGMAQRFCSNWQHAAIAVVAGLLVLYINSPGAQIGVIVIGGAAGFLMHRSRNPMPVNALATPVSPRVAIVSFVVFVSLLIGLPALRGIQDSHGVALFDAVYRSGALVFGGGHVVLPLLRDAFVEPGWVSEDAFLAGYGAAQAIPGPLFTFAAYLGVIVVPSRLGIAGAVLGIIGIFLPGMLLLLAMLPFWKAVGNRHEMQAVLSGINAAVVGLLGATLYTPLWTSSVNTKADFAVAAMGLLLLSRWHVPPWLVVALGALAGFALNLA